MDSVADTAGCLLHAQVDSHPAPRPSVVCRGVRACASVQVSHYNPDPQLPPIRFEGISGAEKTRFPDKREQVGPASHLVFLPCSQIVASGRYRSRHVAATRQLTRRTQQRSWRRKTLSLGGQANESKRSPLSSLRWGKTAHMWFIPRLAPFTYLYLKAFLTYTTRNKQQQQQSRHEQTRWSISGLHPPTQSSPHGQCSGRRDPGPWGAGVTYHSGDVARLPQHLGQGGLVERQAPHRGDREVVRDSVAKAEPPGEQGRPGGRARGGGRVEVHEPARKGEGRTSRRPPEARLGGNPMPAPSLRFQHWEKARRSPHRRTGQEKEAQRGDYGSSEVTQHTQLAL